MDSNKKLYVLAPISKKCKSRKDHHLYNNRGVYWISLTFHSIDGMNSERKRISLKTNNLEKAIYKRDKILRSLKGIKVTL